MPRLTSIFCFFGPDNRRAAFHDGDHEAFVGHGALVEFYPVSMAVFGAGDLRDLVFVRRLRPPPAAG